ncbi:MAG: phospholipid/cholesterol/gamma-HCH transport system substrate-binding protein [Lysobacterales bacterium]|jgi:phospholipid/cholesterol/gamma-HCH transport system substrate-binding protein
MKRNKVEIIVGLFIVIGIGCMAYISVNLGGVDLFNKNNYPLKATFTSVTGLKENTNVEIAGVIVGKVNDIILEDYQATVTMLIDNTIEVQDDAIASIRTKGILGENYIEILPGASDIVLGANESIFDTEPPFDLISIIKNFVVDGD